MPQITDYKPPKKFQKKEYRPWNILEEIKKEKPDLKLVTIGQQLDTDIDNNKVTIGQQLDTDIMSLRGVQKNILFYIVSQCLLGGGLTTRPITNAELTNASKASYGTTKESLLRLVKKGWVIRKNGKRGRDGFYRLSIKEDIKNAVVRELHIASLATQLDNDIGNNIDNMASRSSSIYINKTTTNFTTSTREIVDNFSFPDEWEEIDIEPLAFIKFTKAHLDQIYKAGKISPDMLQASIHAFAFDLQINDKAKFLKLSPLNVFMGMMKKGSPYLPPDNYESPEEQAMRTPTMDKELLK